MKAFVDGNMVGLVNDDFIDLQQSDVVWVDRCDMPVVRRREAACPVCWATMTPVMSGEWYCPVCDRWIPIIEEGTKKRRLGFQYPHKVTVAKGLGREKLRHVYDDSEENAEAKP